MTGLNFGAFACLVGGNKFYYYEIYRNDEMLNEIFPVVKSFWEDSVCKLVEPELVGTDADREYVSDVNSGVIKGSEIVLEDDVSNDLARTVKECKAHIKELEKAIEEASNRIKDRMKLNEICHTKDYYIKWSPRSQVRVDTDRFKSVFPEIYEQCKKTISYREMRIK